MMGLFTGVTWASNISEGAHVTGVGHSFLWLKCYCYSSLVWIMGNTALVTESGCPSKYDSMQLDCDKGVFLCVRDTSVQITLFACYVLE